MSAALPPEGKLDYIKDRERAGHGVCMIGDGINDAPALKCATVGIAMGASAATLPWTRRTSHSSMTRYASCRT